MNIAEKNGQPSMEEILASIRRIIADEPQGGHPVIDIRAPRPVANLVQSDDDQPDFDLPAIFRPQPPVEKPAPLLGRLTDAIRSASGSAVSNFRNGSESHDPYQPGGMQNGAGPSHPVMPDPPLSALNMSRASEVQGQQRVMSAVAAEPAPSPQPAVEPVQAAPERKNGNWYTPAPQSAAPQSPGDVKRVMAPFRDTRMVRMSSMHEASASESAAHIAAEPIPAPSPAPAAQPAQSYAAPAEQVAFFTPMPALEAVSPMAAEMPVDAAVYTPAAPGYSPTVPATAAEAPVQSVAAVHQPIDSIENATADLLRPMLRQWLAENMPRMVEKALHIEVAESVKAQRKSGE